ncbi:MAG: RNA polymerase sigma factor [Thermodesulfobacteriota bacterium]|nr:MAG: RNA polymerase sigma factor [Thermodesulfobacteriota bacterium]
MKESNTALLEIEESYDSRHKHDVNESSNNTTAHNLYSLPFKYKEATDEALVSLYVNNQDEEAFNQIVEKYKDIIMGFSMKLIRNMQDAEEIRQDVFLILITKLHTYKGNSKFSTWLYRVTLNTCYKYLNHTKKRTNKEVNLDETLLSQATLCPQWKTKPDEIVEYQERMKVIDGAVNELTQSNREIFSLKDIHGFSNAEIGKLTGLSLSAVKSRVLRTRLSLKEKISDYFSG